MDNVIELTILAGDEESGVTAISLVDRPAIEVNFIYFKSEEVVEPIIEEFTEEDLDIPYDISSIYTDYEIETMIELAKTLGVSGNDVHMNKEKFSKMVNETLAETEVTYLYKYTSSNVASKTRTFCSAMESINRYFTKEEILTLDNLNTGFGPGVGGGRYNVFKYKGGANCQHYWAKYKAIKYKDNYFITPSEPLNAEERLAGTAPRTLSGRGYVKNPQRGLPPLAGNVAFHFADEDKRIIVSPIMIPDIDILRYDDNGEEYFVKFSPDTIAQVAEKFMKQARTNETNIDHTASVNAGSYLFESWIIETETDKAITKYGFDLPIGTWVGKFKVEDNTTWSRVKSGELRGLSVEGFFIDAEELDAKNRYETIRKLIDEVDSNEI